MEYNNDTVRRQDRLLPEENAVNLLRNGEYGFLSMTTENGKSYGIPLNYVWDGESIIYIHCAPDGKKLKAISAHPDVSFCVVGKTKVVPNQFTTGYESIVLTATAHTELSPEEKWKALRLLVDKYSPEFKEIGDKYIEKSFHRTAVIRLDVTEMSGKTKRTKS